MAREIHSACQKTTATGTCYETLLVPLAKEGKVKLAMGALGQLSAMDPGVRRDGHVYAHAIGIAAGDNASDVAAAFTQCSESFQSGCYHGVIQAYFAGLDSVTAPQANKLCEPFRARESDRWIRFQCVHGMGHGLTMLYRHDLPRGLQGCDLLSDNWDRASCYGGAFMENIVNVTNPHHPASHLAKTADDASKGGGEHDHAAMEGEKEDHSSHHAGTTTSTPFKAVDPADPHYPCSKMADRYLRACYEMQTSVMLHNNKGDIGAAAKACDTAPGKMRTVCYASLGRDISAYSQQNHAEGIRMCSLGAPRYQPWCYFGLVKNLVDLNARSEDGMSLCRVVPDSASKTICYAAVGEQISILATSEEGRRSMCGTAEPGYLNACLYGSGIKVPPPEELTAVWNATGRM